MPTLLETVARLKDESVSGALAKASKADLEAYAAALCHPNACAEMGDRLFPQICETVRVHLLRAHIESLQEHVVDLHDHITNLNRKNTKTQAWVIALAIAALISTGIQTIASVVQTRMAFQRYHPEKPLPPPSALLQAPQKLPAAVAALAKADAPPPRKP